MAKRPNRAALGPGDIKLIHYIQSLSHMGDNLIWKRDSLQNAWKDWLISMNAYGKTDKDDHLIYAFHSRFRFLRGFICLGFSLNCNSCLFCSVGISVPKSFLNLVSWFWSCCGTFTKNGTILAYTPFFEELLRTSPERGWWWRGRGTRLVLQGIETFVHKKEKKNWKSCDEEKSDCEYFNTKHHSKTKRRLNLCCNGTGRQQLRPGGMLMWSAPHGGDARVLHSHTATALSANTPKKKKKDLPYLHLINSSRSHAYTKALS